MAIVAKTNLAATASVEDSHASRSRKSSSGRSTRYMISIGCTRKPTEPVGAPLPPRWRRASVSPWAVSRAGWGKPEQAIYEELITALLPVLTPTASVTADGFVRWLCERLPT